MNGYIHIGKVVAATGTKGELLISHVLKTKTSLENTKAVFIETRRETYIPYFILHAKGRDEELLTIQLEGIETREAARVLVSRNVWLPDEDFRRLAGHSAPLSLLGYLVINEGETLSEIEEVIEQPHQVLLRITLGGREALIPLHAETLARIDRKKKQVHVVLPEGLLDIYR